MQYDAHPLAEVFPLMTEAELSGLADGIRVSGLIDPIVLLDGRVLDGRNRLAACERVGVTPRFIQFDGNDPVAFVLNKNLHRRSLSESQRAMVGAKLANLSHGGNRKGQDQAANLQLDPPPISVPKAAEMVNVSGRLVSHAKQVERDAVPELVEQVRAGEVTVSTAAVVAKLPEDEQAEVVKQGPKAVKERAAKERAKPKAEQEPATPPQHKPIPKRERGVGVMLAHEAVNRLHKIPDADPEMGQAVKIVAAWLTKHQ